MMAFQFEGLMYLFLFVPRNQIASACSQSAVAALQKLLQPDFCACSLNIVKKSCQDSHMTEQPANSSLL